MKKIVFSITFFLSLSFYSLCSAYPVADVLQFPLDNYEVGCNGFWGTCVKEWHLGEDAKAKATDKVFAIGNGIVKHAAYHDPNYDDDGNLITRNYGGMYIIEHTLSNGEKTCSLYAHMNFSSFTHKTEGEEVVKGEYLGDIGNYNQNGGWSEHLHLGIRKGAYPDNPYEYKCGNWIFSGYTSCEDIKNDWYDPTDFIINNGCSGGTADNSVRWHPNGTIIKFANAPEVYVIQDRTKKHIPTPNVLRSWYEWSKVITVPKEEIDAYPQTSDLLFQDGTLLGNSNDGKVYFVTDDGRRRWISTLETFNQLGYNQDNVHWVSDGELKEETLEELTPPLNETNIYLSGIMIHPSGTLIRGSDGKVYLLSGVNIDTGVRGFKQHIYSPTVLTSWFSWNDVITVSGQEVNSYSTMSYPVVYQTGTLIKSKSADEVYVLENGVLRHITDSTVFDNMGYTWCRIMEVEDAELNGLLNNYEGILGFGDEINLSTITTPPSGDTSSPILGMSSQPQTLVANQNHTISWTAFDERAGNLFLDLFYSFDNWVTTIKINTEKIINSIHSQTTDSYTWNVPDSSGDFAIRIVGYDEAGNVDFDHSDTLNIVSDCPTPPAPILYDPSVSGYNYTLSWSDVTEAESYILQEDTDPAFTNPTENSYTQTSEYFPNRPEGSYHYRVCGVNNCGRGIWSNTESVSISGRQWPGDITDRFPVNGATNQPLNPTLGWNCTHPTGESMVYDVWLSVGDEYFNSPELVSTGQTGTTYTATDLPYNTMCYWKIEARDETGDRKLSDVYQFTTIGDSTPPTGSVLINSGAATTETLSVTLSLSATDSESGVKYMRASNDGSNWSYWKYYSATWPAWSLGNPQYGGSYVPQGTYTVYVQFKDEQGNISATYTDSIEKVSGTAGDIILNGESYQTIQDAIDAAEYGETVYLTEGTFTYQGSQKPPRYPLNVVGVVMKAGVNLIGAGANKTTVELEYGQNVIIDADDCLIQGMTIINADPAPAARESVKMESSNSKLRDCKITTSGSDNYGVWLYNGTNNEISNNLIINNKYGIFVWGTNVKIYNNTVINNELTGITNNSSTSILRNNIVTGNYRGVRVSGAVFTHNNVWGNTYENYSDGDQTGINNNISADPLFVNPASGDYSLNSGSSCRNAGTDVGFPYNESAPDMGAFEYGGSGTVEVVTNRSDAAFEIIGPSGTYQGSGTYWSMSGLPLGIYSVAFPPIANLYTPEYEAKILQSNQTITFDGTYANDTIPPQAEPENFLAPVSVNYGEYATADTLVDIVLDLTDEVAGLGTGAQMMFSNDGASWSSPEPYSTLKKDWDLTQFGGNSTQGMKTVYVKVSDAFGNWTAPLTDTILYVPNRQILVVPEAYTTIQEALNAASAGDIVHVLPGSYNLGEIIIPQDVHLQGSGFPLTTLTTSKISMSSNTTIDGFTLMGWSEIRCNTPVSGVIIANNVFTEGGYGVLIFSGSQVIVRNNIFDGLNYGGIYLESPQAAVSASIENNTFVNTAGYSAIDLSNASPDTRVYVYNNILANNSGYAAIRDDNTHDTEHKHIFSQFNTFWNNTQGDFGGVNSDKITGAGDFNADPMFMDAGNGDYSLLPGSPCINSGYPEDRYHDRDRTRNDRGVHGGPRLNTPPHAEFLIGPTLIGINTPFSLDASFSSDGETETASLLVRWDFDNDSTYDTNFATTKTETHQYGALGTHTIGLQVKDNNGSVASTTSQVAIENSSPNIPGSPTPLNGSLDQGINVTLSWQGGDPDPGDTVTYDVYFGTSSNPPLASSGQTGTTYNPGTLQYFTFYYWKIVATDNHGASSLSPVWHFVTQAEPVPQAPTNLSTNAASSSQIDLTWTNNSNNEIGFKIERKIGTGGTWSQIYVVGAGTINYSDTGLNSDTTYYYRVRSYNASGNSAYSNEANALTFAAIPYFEDFSDDNHGFVLEDDNSIASMYISETEGRNGSRCLVVENSQPVQHYEVLTKKVGFDIQDGSHYVGRIYLRGNQAGTVYVNLSRDVEPWGDIGLWHTVNLRTEWQAIHFDFTVTGNPQPEEVRFALDIGEYQGTVFIDDIEINPSQPVPLPYSEDFSDDDYGFIFKNDHENKGNASMYISDSEGRNSSRCLVVENSQVVQSYEVRVQKIGIDIQDGAHYSGQIYLRGNQPGTVYVLFIRDVALWDNLGLWRGVNVTTEWQEIDLNFTATENVVPGEVRFAVEIGEYQGTVFIDDMEIHLAPEINLKQGSTDIPSGTGSHDFGAVTLGTSTTATFTIENTGNATLSVTGITFGGANPGDFSSGTLPSSVAPGTSDTFDITLTPGVTGECTAEVSIVNNDSDEDPYTFTVTGTGQAQASNSYLLWTK